MLPSKKLTVIYDKVVWAWICRDFKTPGRKGATEKEIQRDAVAKTTFERFGITSYPHLTFVDPYKGTIIGRSARNVDSLLRTAKAAAAKVKRPGKGFDALKEKFDSAQALLKKGKKEQAKKGLEELLEPADPWEFYVEAREILASVGAYRKPKLPDARELKDPFADRRAEVLEFYRDHFPETPFEPKALALSTDTDGLVRLRCAEYVAAAAPTKLSLRHLDTMLHDPLDTVKHVAINHLLKNPDPSYKGLLLKVQAEHKRREIPSSNPNSIKGGIERALKANDFENEAGTAKEAASQGDIPILDVCSAITPHLDEYQKPEDCHFKPEGYELLGKMVAKAILDELEKPSKKRGKKSRPLATSESPETTKPLKATKMEKTSKSIFWDSIFRT